MVCIGVHGGLYCHICWYALVWYVLVCTVVCIFECIGMYWHGIYSWYVLFFDMYSMYWYVFIVLLSTPSSCVHSLICSVLVSMAYIDKMVYIVLIRRY